MSDDDCECKCTETLTTSTKKVNLCISYLHAAACQIESSKGEGTAEPRFSQQAAWRYDKAGPGHLEEPPSNQENNEMSAADLSPSQQWS